MNIGTLSLEIPKETSKEDMPLFIGFDSSGSGINMGLVLVGRVRSEGEKYLVLLEPVVFGRMITVDKPSGTLGIGSQIMPDVWFETERNAEINVNAARFTFWKILGKEHKNFLKYSKIYDTNLEACFARAAGIQVISDHKKL